MVFLEKKPLPQLRKHTSHERKNKQLAGIRSSDRQTKSESNIFAINDNQMDVDKLKLVLKEQWEEQPHRIKTMSMGGSIFDSIIRCICNVTSMTIFLAFSLYISREYRYTRGFLDCTVLTNKAISSDEEALSEF